jgi:hypothetical protein
MDNSLIHKLKSITAKIWNMPAQLARHPPYWPDLAPFDFFRFGHLKSQMIGRELDSPENLIRWIRAVLRRISRGTIERVCDEWIDQVERCISHEGSYFPEE